ncbi:glutamate--tRNA ligase [Streptomyces doebereineriae]|uniref:Glutamate--tRNA ligase n=1 Tax=Streptomyces doebereineriae TaxID=3075528 RepID=A0ABU2VMR8_9ACTN|nr:glutamate--tRNA ligase family protein [Streptomyces sp. DSM 41640]MDT0486906.1 glutamate--tRNA ligase family protein [Streptomyces sp. DSM 41640]
MPDRSVINALFPQDLPEAADWPRRYPPRRLPAGAEVTRFAPSPTGVLHIGGLYTAAVSRALAHQTGGVHLLRVEDTDQSREVAGAAGSFIRLLEAFGLSPDEGASVAADAQSRTDAGVRGPYLQSERREIYLSHVRDLLRRDMAYLCFCDKDQLAANAQAQRASRSPLGYYGRWAACRTLSDSEVEDKLAAGTPYVVRFRCPHEFPGRVRIDDRIRGSIVMQDNGNDVVLLKSSQETAPLPTYHLAHVVDDHLMGVTLVVRGEEWLSSTPLHLQLHTALGFPVPHYAHLAPLMKAEGPSRRKLSKRKDPEAAVEYYLSAGYPPRAVRHYLSGLANARLMDLPTAQALAAPVRIHEMRPTGPLVDLPKLNSISREYIAALTANEVHAQLLSWAADHDTDLHTALTADPQLARQAISVAQGTGAQIRKDLTRWSDFRDRFGFLLPSLAPQHPASDDERFDGLAPALVHRIVKDFAANYQHSDNAAAWLDQIRAVAKRHGFAPDTWHWRQNPDHYAGPPRQVAGVIRVCVTGAERSPDLFAVAQALGEQEVRRRLTLRT